MKTEDMYKPLGDIVVVQVDTPKTETASGIVIKEDWRTLPPTGVVLAVGPEVTRVHLGERVVFERYSAVTLEEGLRLCKQSHILAVKTN